MSLHNDPNYQIPALVAALKHHCLTHDAPSQLADSFRTGWVAAIAAATAHPMAWAIFAENGNCRMWTQNKGHADVAAKDTGLPLTALYAAPQPAAQALDAGQWTQDDLREFCAIGRATNRSAVDLPDFSRIRIDLENGSGAVYWLDNKAGKWRCIDSGDLLSTQIDAAIGAAIAAQQGGANG